MGSTHGPIVSSLPDIGFAEARWAAAIVPEAAISTLVLIRVAFTRLVRVSYAMPRETSAGTRLAAKVQMRNIGRYRRLVDGHKVRLLSSPIAGLEAEAERSRGIHDITFHTPVRQLRANAIEVFGDNEEWA